MKPGDQILTLNQKPFKDFKDLLYAAVSNEKKFDEKQGKTRETFLAFSGNNPIKEIFAQVRVL